MPDRVVTLRLDGRPYRATLRVARSADLRKVIEQWEPVLERGPRSWLDREWSWDALDNEVAFDRDPQTIVIVDEIEEAARHDVLGIALTTGLHTPAAVQLDPSLVGGPLLWLEYIAIAPSLRDDCPAADRRGIVLKAVGSALMLAAIDRSEALGCEGRIALHAEGEQARTAYLRWTMKELPEAPHPEGGSYPVFFGSSEWSGKFQQRIRGAK